MNDMERRLRELSARALDDVPQLSPNDKVLRRIRRRRGALAVAAAMSILVVVAGGVFASSSLFGSDRAPAPVAPPTEANCAAITFEPTYVPPGFDAKPAPSVSPDGSRPEAGEEIGRYHGPTEGAFISLSVAPISGFARTDRESLTVLGRSADLAVIHEGLILRFRSQDCTYDAEAFGVTRSQFRRFARGLRDNVMTFEQVYESGSGLMWPEDTRAAARAACSSPEGWRTNQMSVALSFAQEVLGWTEPGAREVVGGSEGEVRVSEPKEAVRGVRGIAHMFTTEVRPGCWSLASISRPPERASIDVGISIRGRTAQIGVLPLERTTARVEIGYGGRNRSASWDPSDGPATIRLGFDPDTDGHYLVLLMTEQGRIFSAIGGPLPPGDFSTG